ncbi:MAG: class I SAM-dependent methyltransferase [Pseudonocardia sp.]
MKQHRVFAATYDLMLRSVERRSLGRRRHELLEGLTGRVLDIGAGTGVNLPYYRDAALVTLAEPDAAMRAKLTAKLGDATVPVRTSDAPAEALPFPDASFEAVVSTLVLCTVVDPDRALAEIRRVLAPGGQLVLLEHVRGTGGLARWQDRLTPLWRHLAAGCHLNRDTRAAVERAGFAVTAFEPVHDLPGWVPISSMIQAVATSA